MKESDIQRIQDEIMSGMNKEQAAEEMVKNLSEEIAAKLVLDNRTTAEVEDTEYMFAYKTISQGKRKGIFMTVANMNKYRIVQEKYKPYTVTAEFDNNFTLRENLQAVVEAYLRHILDMVKAEEL
ncbi:hypothetical protein [Bacillus atrophaeus]|uniref:hypothetical protein n=1 Tax=Bacillus atrophaeus TaxID=1452 RepID=UPI002E1F0893|nr:hypothetical protein [Bacillus atrophaeus]